MRHRRTLDVPVGTEWSVLNTFPGDMLVLYAEHKLHTWDKFIRVPNSPNKKVPEKRPAYKIQHDASFAGIEIIKTYGPFEMIPLRRVPVGRPFYVEESTRKEQVCLNIRGVRHIITDGTPDWQDTLCCSSKYGRGGVTVERGVPNCKDCTEEPTFWHEYFVHPYHDDRHEWDKIQARQRSKKKKQESFRRRLPTFFERMRDGDGLNPPSIKPKATPEPPPETDPYEGLEDARSSKLASRRDASRRLKNARRQAGGY